MNLDNIKQYIYTNERTKVNTKGRKARLTYRLNTQKDKPSSINKRTKILSKYDAKILSTLSELKITNIKTC